MPGALQNLANPHEPEWIPGLDKIFGKIQIYSTRLIQSGGTIDVRNWVPRWNENSLVGHHLVSQNREFSLVYDPILGREQLIKIIAKK